MRGLALPWILPCICALGCSDGGTPRLVVQSKDLGTPSGTHADQTNDEGKSPLPGLRYLLTNGTADAVNPSRIQTLTWGTGLEQLMPDARLRPLDAAELEAWQVQVVFPFLQRKSEWHAVGKDLTIDVRQMPEGIHRFEIHWKHTSGFVHVSQSPLQLLHADLTAPVVGSFRFDPVAGFTQSYLAQVTDEGRLPDGYLMAFLCPEDQATTPLASRAAAAKALTECEILSNKTGQAKAVGELTAQKIYLPGPRTDLGNLAADAALKALFCAADAAGNESCAWTTAAKPGEASEQLSLYYDGSAFERTEANLYSTRADFSIPLRVVHIRNGAELRIDRNLNPDLAAQYELAVDAGQGAVKSVFTPALPYSLTTAKQQLRLYLRSIGTGATSGSPISVTLHHDATAPVVSDFTIAFEGELAADTVVTYAWKCTDDTAISMAESYWRPYGETDWQPLESSIPVAGASVTRTFRWGERAVGSFELQVRVRDRAGRESIVEATRSL